MSKQKTMPFTTIKLHFEGETFAPVTVNGKFELQGAFSVMVGSNGNPYQFATAENAAKWLDDTLVKTSRSGETKQAHIDALILKLSDTGYDFIQTEIDTIEARNAGEWSVYFGDDLLAEYGVVVRGEKGDKGDKGDTGAAGVGTQGPAGPSGITWLFPIGHILIGTGAANPATWLGYGTWAAFGAGRVLIGQDTAQTEFDVLEETGGEKAHILTVGEMPSHTHTQNAHNHVQMASTSTTTGGVQHSKSGQNGATAAGGSSMLESTAMTTATNNNTGGGAAFNILQPYIVVKFWKRTA